MAASSQASVTSKRDARESDRALLLVFLVAYPLLVYPQYLIEMVWQRRGIFFSNGELVYYIPRLVAMLLLVLLTWRSWTLRGWFPKLLVANGVWIAFVTVLHPDPDGLWYTLGGNLDRLDGLAYQMLLVGVGMTAYGLWRRAPLRVGGGSQRVPAAMALSGLMPGALVLLQGAGVDPIGWLVWGKRLPFASATLGHPAFVACLLLISALLTLHIVDVGRRKLAWIAVLVVEATALGVTGNRSALIALVAGLTIVWWTRRTRATVVLGAIVLLLAVAGGLAPKWFGSTRTNGEAHMVDPQTLETRLQLWHIANRVLLSSPNTFLTGFGSAGLLYAAIEKLPPKALVPFWRLEKSWAPDTVVRFTYASNGPQFRDVIATAVLRSPNGKTHSLQFYPGVDKAHDYFLDRALAYGVVDTVLWALLFLVPLGRALLRRVLSPQHAALCAVIGALLVFGITLFGVVQTEPLQLVVLASSWGALGASARGREHVSAPPVANGT